MLTREEKNSINRIHLFVGQSRSTTREFFESLAAFIVMEHLNNREVVIPFLGKLTLSYEGDEISKLGKQAVVKTQLEPSPMIVRSIGQAHDREITEAESVLLERLRGIFEQHEKGTFNTGGSE